MTAFDALAERLGPDRLNAYAVEHGLAKDDPGWVGAVQMLPLLDELRTLGMALSDVVTQLGATLGTIDHKALAAHIAGQVSARVGRGFAARFRIQWGIIGGALALAIFICGLFVGRGLDLGHYREQYEEKIMALPHVRNVLLSPRGAAISSLIARNDSATLYELARCSSDLGLRLLPARGGGDVCAGVGASKGFWIAP
ncbi:MAG: hypothetical protein ACYDB9_09655 [Gammaproteobacteria bacterium]